MPDLTAPEHHPFDPAVPDHLDAFIAAWQTDIGTDETLPVGEALHVDGQWRVLTLGELIQIRDRLAFAEKTRLEIAAKTRLELAEKCATYRSERDDYHAKADALVNNLAKARGERDRLRSVLLDVLGASWRHGHPGYAAMQSAWVAESRFQGWRAVLAETGPGTPGPAGGALVKAESNED